MPKRFLDLFSFFFLCPLLVIIGLLCLFILWWIESWCVANVSVFVWDTLQDRDYNGDSIYWLCWDFPSGYNSANGQLKHVFSDVFRFTFAVVASAIFAVVFFRLFFIHYMATSFVVHDHHSTSHDILQFRANKW